MYTPNHKVVISLDRNAIPVAPGRIVSAGIVAAISGGAVVIVDGILTWVNSSPFDVTSRFKDGATSFEILFSGTFYPDDDIPFSFIVDYMLDDVGDARTAIPLGRQCSASLDLATGEAVLSVAGPSLCGVETSFALRSTGLQSECGPDAAFSLDQRVFGYAGSRFYAGTSGMVEEIREKFFYVDGLERVVVEKSQVSADGLGSLYATVGGKRREIHREEATASGLVYTSAPRGLPGLEHFDFRDAEVKELSSAVEEAVRSLSTLVVYDLSNGEIVGVRPHFSQSADNFSDFLAQATAGRSVVDQHLVAQIAGLIVNRSNYVAMLQSAQESGEVQIAANAQAQIDVIQAQLDAIGSSAELTKARASEMYSKMLEQRLKLAELRLSTPASALRMGDTVLGFNDSGMLCAIIRPGASAVLVSRRLGVGDSHIESLSCDGLSARLLYDGAGKLIGAEGDDGFTEIEYDAADRLSLIRRPGGDFVRLIWGNSRLPECILTSDQERFRPAFDAAGRLSSLSAARACSYISATSAAPIKESSAESSASFYDTRRWAISYGDGYAKVDSDADSVECRYDSLHRVREEVCWSLGTCVSAVIRFHVEGEFDLTIVPKRVGDMSDSEFPEDARLESLLDDLDVPDLATHTGGAFPGIGQAEYEYRAVDPFGRVSLIATGWREVSPGRFERKESAMVYDPIASGGLCLRATTTSFSSAADGPESVQSVLIEERSFNESGLLLSSSSRFAGEELALGIDASEFNYDSNGVLIRSCRSNSLDASARLVSVFSYDESSGESSSMGPDESAPTRARSGAFGVELESPPAGEPISRGYGRDGRLASVSRSTASGARSFVSSSERFGLTVGMRTESGHISVQRDKKGRPTSVSLSGANLATFAYAGSPFDSLESVSSPANGDQFPSVRCRRVTATEAGIATQDFIDAEGRLVARKRGGALVYSSSWADSFLSSEYLGASVSFARTVAFERDAAGNVSSAEVKLGSNVVYREAYSRDSMGRVTSTTYGDSSSAVSYSYSNDSRGLLMGLELPSGHRVTVERDSFGRIVGTTLATRSGTVLAREGASYRQLGERACPQVSTVSRVMYSSGAPDSGSREEYAYDAAGRLTEVRAGGIVSARYRYDGAGRLDREDNRRLGTTVLYGYDGSGNMLWKRTAPFSLGEDNEIVASANETLLVYSGDRLARFGDGRVSYDSYGRAVSYLGSSVAWSGNRATSFAGNMIAYDGKGRVVSVGLDEFLYRPSGGLASCAIGGSTLRFIPGPDAPLGFSLGGSDYLYVRNALGDVAEILSLADGSVAARYAYDAWGKHVVLSADGQEDTNPQSVGNLNPIRYRGYTYCAQIGMYLLGERLYDPAVGRFVGRDSAEFLDTTAPDGLNLYAYCHNDPIGYADATGHFAITISFLIGLGIAVGTGALIGATSYTISECLSYAVTRKWSWSWGQFLGNVLGGALGGALAFITPAASPILIAGLTGFSSSAFGMMLQNQWEGTKYSDGQIIMTSLANGLLSAGAAAISNAIHIPGLNSGRNSYSAISKQIVTKFRNGSISRITYATFSKLLTLNLVESIIGSTVSGFTDAFDANDWMIDNLFWWA